VVKIGIDPHFSYANMLCDVAWARSHGTATFLIPDGGTSASELAAKAVERDMPGLPTAVVKMFDILPAGQVCGRCTSFKDGTCVDRAMIVQPKDPGCTLFVTKSGQ